MPEIIGRGEKVAQRILDFMFPGCYVLPQLPMRYLRDKYCPDYEIDISEENLKRTVDLFVVSGEFNKKDHKIVVRVQDSKTHNGTLKSKIDSVQRGMINDFGLACVDLLEIECKELFKNKLNHKSIYEVSRAIHDQYDN